MDRKRKQLLLEKKKSKHRPRQCVTSNQTIITTTTPSVLPPPPPPHTQQKHLPKPTHSSLSSTIENSTFDLQPTTTSSNTTRTTTGSSNNSSSNSSHVPPPERVDDTMIRHRLPPSFPSHLIRPDYGFLRNVTPYETSFQYALQSSYEGFVVDYNVLPNEATIQATLQSNEMESFFVTDITQPFGLGTICTPTYVTRCLMGDSGTTYKYLGLRMFAHPWNKPIHDLKEHLSTRVTQQHLPQLYRHRQFTTTVSNHHLHHNNNSTNHNHSSDTSITTRALYPSNSTKSSSSSSSSSSCFDICLINRMTMNPKLKTEPLDEDHKTTVSWHADSSLEHYSTIAVYQTIVHTNTNTTTNTRLDDQTSITRTTPPTTKCQNDTNEWSIGLRVSPNVEGPKINHSRQDQNNDDNNNNNNNKMDVAPPIAVSLPTNSAYYLLDDFNHHHQHTVLVHKHSSSSPSIRYSLTFRLLRDSHNVHDMIHRCQRCVSQFHKKGSKTYRFEQLTLSELESEWLRQFYIQGRHHHQILWDEWGDFVMKLWDYWNQLEARTFHTIQMLGHAAEGRCFNQQNVQSSTSAVTDECAEDQKSIHSNSLLKLERKLRAKRKKAVSTILELLKRESTSVDTTPSRDHTISLYESFASVLEERATMRELWQSREADPIFKKMGEQYRPIPFPARYGSTENADVDIAATSPSHNDDSAIKRPLGMSLMPGASYALKDLARTIRTWGLAFLSCDSNDLPDFNPLNEPLHKAATTCKKNTSFEKSDREDTTIVVDNADIVPMNWDGWKTHDFGLEMQYPWSRALLDGRKSIEIRRYDLPSSLLGRKIHIIETPVGKDGVSSIVGNHFQNNAIINESPDDSICGANITNQQPRIMGWAIFSTVKQYKSHQDFCLDEKHHLVPIDSAYGWQNGDTPVLFGWVVSECGYVSPNDSCFASGLRRFRSLFQLALVNDSSGIKQSRPTVAKVADVKQKKSTKNRYPNYKNDGRSSINPSLPTKKRRF